MTTAALRISTPLPEARTAPRSATTIAPKKGFFARLMTALTEARMRQAMREVARHQHMIPENMRKEMGDLPFVRGA